MDADSIFRQIQTLDKNERLRLLQKLWATYAQDIEDLTWLAFSVDPENDEAEARTNAGGPL